MGQGKVSFFKNSRLFNDEELKFRLINGLKMTLISLTSFIILGFLISLVLRVNGYFFEANQILEIKSFRETFYEFLYKEFLKAIPSVGLLLIFVNFISTYVSHTLLRPFRVIGDYCEKKKNKEEASYDQDFFTNLKLLNRFSELFFSYIELSFKEGHMSKFEVPKKYTKIRRPVFESAFFLQYMLFIIISLLAVSFFIYSFAMNLNESMIELATQTLPKNIQINYFLTHQSQVIDLIVTAVLMTHVIMYGLLSYHLYLKVAGPAFGIFATMRSFLRGNYKARVHLIGFNYLRPECRKLNKYLDFIERELIIGTSNK